MASFVMRVNRASKMVKFFIKFALKMKILLILDKKFHFLGTFVADFGRPKGPSTNFGKMKKL